MGVAIGPGQTIVFAELGTGRVHALRSGNVETLASDLRDPVGVAIAPDGCPLVAESGAGRVMKLTRSGADVVVDGLHKPQGLVVCDGQLYVVDAGLSSVRNLLLWRVPLAKVDGVLRTVPGARTVVWESSHLALSSSART